MKGIVFTAFIQYVEDSFGDVVVEQMISGCDLSTDGAYTTVGTYDHGEIVQMMIQLAKLSDREVPALVKDFGFQLFGTLVSGYPEVVKYVNDSFGLVATIDNHIHVEVRKLYPDADLPSFSHEFRGPDELRLLYESERGLADLAEGLLLGCFKHFREEIDLQREDLSDGAGTRVAFTMRRIVK
ncbi:heme NO-binding domain-containing protein [bacterium]|nr:heme NO-binding domain-containing protein [bacterium]